MEKLLQSVNLHTVPLDDSEVDVAAYRRLLQADEVRRADRFVNAATADRWQLCRARLRQILATYCNIDPAAIRFSRERYGKPAIESGQCERPLHFNLSHSHRLAVVAVTRIGPVGVDLEYVRPIRDWEGVAARFFSPREQAQLAAVKAGSRLESFYTCWTRKEALIKCTGEGLYASLDEFDVSLTPGANPEVIADRAARSDGKNWQLHHFTRDGGYIGAVAIRSTATVDWRNQSPRSSDLA